MTEISDETKGIISKDPSLCNNWAASRCYYPSGWRNFKGDKNNLEKCKCQWKGNILCNKCEPDTVLYESHPSYFEKKGE